MRHLLLCLLLATAVLSRETPALAFETTIESPLPKDRTQEFRDRYKAQKASGEIKNVMRATFLKAFGRAGEGTDTPVHYYATALEKAFYDDNGGTSSRKLAAVNRERVLIPLLASRTDDFALAVHICMGWLEGIDPDEIGELLFLGGVYNGVNTMTHSLQVYRRTFKAVDRMDPAVGFPQWLKILNEEFTTEKAPPRG